MKFDPAIWGEHYWFFLFTVALSYPQNPNKITKRKYYDLIQNMPLFIPDDLSRENFCKILDRYPVSPYLDSQMAFVKWVHFIHNKINELLGKPLVSFLDALNTYNNSYKPQHIKLRDELKSREKYVFMSVLVLSMVGLYFIY